jgi:hypothetical protein
MERDFVFREICKRDDHDPVSHFAKECRGPVEFDDARTAFALDDVGGEPVAVFQVEHVHFLIGEDAGLLDIRSIAIQPDGMLFIGTTDAGVLVGINRLSPR